MLPAVPMVTVTCPSGSVGPSGIVAIRGVSGEPDDRPAGASGWVVKPFRPDQ
jgi:hypothetical protein